MTEPVVPGNGRRVVQHIVPVAALAAGVLALIGVVNFSERFATKEDLVSLKIATAEDISDLKLLVAKVEKSITVLEARFNLFEGEGPRFSASDAASQRRELAQRSDDGDNALRNRMDERFRTDVPPVIITEQIRVLQEDMRDMKTHQREIEERVWGGKCLSAYPPMRP